jgi:hypothetical protein
VSDHPERVKRVVTDLWDPSSKVKEQDVELLMQHLRLSFSDEHALLEALNLAGTDVDQKLARLQHHKEELIDHNLEPDRE